MMLRSSVIVVACTSWSLAQDAPANVAANDLRGPAIGEVRDANGKPWLGAEVVLLARPLPQDPNAGEVDRVVAKVDERGRFRAEILRGRPYTVWAWGEANEKGRPESAVVDRVFVQQPILLKQERILPARDVVLEHTERWDGYTFRVRVVDQTWNRDVHWLDVKDGRARLPWLVAPEATIELFAARDATLHPLTSTATPAATGDVSIAVPEREHVTCFAMDENDKPLADAPILRSLGDALYRVGTTDAAGKLALDIATTGTSNMPTFVLPDVGGIGVFMRLRDAKQLADTAKPAGAEPNDLFCRTPNGGRTYARFLDAAGKPMASLAIRCQSHGSNRPTRASATWEQVTAVFDTDADGRVALPGEPQNMAITTVLLRENDVAALPAAWRPGLVPVVFAPFAAATGTGTKDDPYVVTPQQMCPVDFAFVGAGGTPLANVDVRLSTLAADHYAIWPWQGGCGAISDERGHIRVLVPAAQHVGVAATAGMSMLIRAFETTTAHLDAGPAGATMQLPPPTGIRGRLLDKTGAPARDRLVHASFGSNDKPAQWDYASEPGSVLTRAKGNAMRILMPEDKRERLVLTSLIGVLAPVDSEGRFVLPLPAVPIPDLLLFNAARGTRVFADSQRVEWTGQTIDDLELRARF